MNALCSSWLQRRALFSLCIVLLTVIFFSLREILLICRQPTTWQTLPITPPLTITDVLRPRAQLTVAKQILTYGRPNDSEELSGQAHSSELSSTDSLSPTALTNSTELGDVTEQSRTSLATPLQDPSPERHGYLLVLKSVAGSQQAAGLRSFLPAQCWVGSFDLPMKVVQPFIDGSIVHTRPSQGSLTMADFIDIGHFNNVSRKLGWAGVVSWQEFVAKAPRKVIYVIPKHFFGCRCLDSRERAEQLPMKVLWTQSDHENGSCYNVYDDKVLDLHTLTASFDFCVVRVVEVHPTPRMCKASELDVIFGKWKPSEVTLIVKQWCPSMYVPNPALPNPEVCKSACAELADLFHPSQQLLSHVEAYERKHSPDHEHFRAAVMLRSEHVFMEAVGIQQKVSVLKACLSRTIAIAYSIQAGSMNEPLFLTLDVGRYGSGDRSWSATLGRYSVREVLLLMVKDAAMRLLNTSLTFEEWEDTFTDAAGTEDRGYIAALQRNVASRANCLIIVGGGNFPRLALMQYLSEHPDPTSWCLHFVCLNSRYSKEYSGEIVSQSHGTVGTTWTPVASDIPWLHVTGLSQSSV